jgi:hypothetical protein
MKTEWLFTKTEWNQIRGRGIAEDNFAHESRSNLEILIRETIQNPLDARDGSNAPVRVTLRKLEKNAINSAYFSGLLTEEFQERLKSSIEDAPALNLGSPVALVIEDFGTTGLQGSFANPDADGDGENWNAFWYSEGEGAKPTRGSNGRAGQGKITYYRTSAARAVFGLTVRADDKNRLLMGRSVFRRAYKYQDAKYVPHAFWCANEGQKSMPVTSPDEINAFRAAFQIKRTTEPGLSLVIPFPSEFEVEEAVRVVLSEFYFPIAAGRLEVSIGDIDVRAANVAALADNYLPEKLSAQKGPFCSKGFRVFIADVVAEMKSGIVLPQLKPGWEKGVQLSAESFPEEILDQTRKKIEEGSRISLRCPVTVKSKKGGAQSTFFDIHLQVPEDMERVEEAYIRKDLLIGSERHIADAGYLQKARGLTLISDSTMSAFLADAEEPTHLKWNASRPRLAEDYVSPKDLVRAVRQALPRLLALLSGQIVKRDVKALAKYFSKPAEKGKSGSEGEKKVGGNQPPPPPLEPPATKLFRLLTGPDWVRVVPNQEALKGAKFPISSVLELAYEGLDLDPFKDYDPFDFDLADAAAFPIATEGMKIEKRERNRIEFTVEELESSLQLSGFDKNIRFRARLTYEEATDGSNLDDQ